MHRMRSPNELMTNKVPASVDAPITWYVAPIGAHGGYGHDARMTARALLAAGVPLRIVPINLPDPTLIHHYGKAFSTIQSAIDADIGPPDVVVFHSEPTYLPRLIASMSELHPKLPRRVLKSVWETSRLPAPWGNIIREAEIKEVWVPCEHNAKVFLSALHNRVPAAVVPHAHDVETSVTVSPEPFVVDGLDDQHELSPSTFVFSSVFQWSPRKNPEALLAAYVSAFSPDDDVVLVLKTFAEDWSPNSGSISSDLYRQDLSRVVTSALDKIRHCRLPRILFLRPALTEEYMMELYARTDCGVYSTRGEGWGLPISQTMLAARPVIAPNWSAPSEYGQQGIDLVHGQLSIVRGMRSPNYTADQRWFDVNENSLAKAMRQRFEQRMAGLELGALGRAQIKKHCDLATVGRQMRALLTNSVEV